MIPSLDLDSGAISPAGKVTRAATSPDRDTAEPAATSGFGAVIEREHDLRLSTETYIGTDEGIHSADIDRILRNQQARLEANIALLEQRYAEASPSAEIEIPGFPLATRPRMPRGQEGSGMLPSLVAQHQKMIADIDLLVSRNPDGQRGRLILTEVARNHEEMAWMLLALLNEDSVHDRSLPPIPDAPGATPEGNWENEGGALQPQGAGTMDLPGNGAR